MKKRLYTKTYNPDLLKSLGNEHEIITAEEHSYVSEKEFGKFFESKESLLQWYLSANSGKLCALGYLIRQVRNNTLANIISFGAGPCVLEYLLKCALPQNTNVVAADYTAFFIDKAQQFFPNIIAVKYDFVKDDIKILSDKLGIKLELAVLFGSSYVMADSEFVHFFKN